MIKRYWVPEDLVFDDADSALEFGYGAAQEMVSSHDYFEVIKPLEPFVEKFDINYVLALAREEVEGQVRAGIISTREEMYCAGASAMFESMKWGYATKALAQTGGHKRDVDILIAIYNEKIAKLETDLETMTKTRDHFHKAYSDSLDRICELRKQMGDDPADY